VQFESEDRTAINDQSIQVNLVQQPTPPIPERVEFFESLQEFSHFLRNGTQDQIQSKLDHFDQMLDIVTLSLADIGSEMGSLEDEITINEDLKLQLKTTLSGEEDLDLASAITKMQAQMMSLEAAQASFAKISQLSLFDYIR
jgi:flagellar hook-associated protein 3 FlgL